MDVVTSWTITGQKSLLSILGAKMQTASKQTWNRVLAVLQVLFRVFLVVLALVAFTVAAWMVAVPLGLVVAGVSLLVVEWLVKR